MTFTRKLFAASMIAAACAVPGALLCSATASAVPAPAPAPAVPGMPNLPFLNGLSPANAPALIQTMAAALTGGTPAAAPAAQAPAATASVTLPQTPALPGMPAAPALPGVPTAPALPGMPATTPQAPSNPLPQLLNFPADLASLAPAGTPLAGLLPKSTVPAVTAPVAAAPLAAAAPAAIAPAVAPTSSVSQLAPLLMPTAALSALP